MFRWRRLHFISLIPLFPSCPRNNSARIRKKWSPIWRVKTSFCQKRYGSLYNWSLEIETSATGLKTGLYSPWHNGVSLRIWIQKKIEERYGLFFIHANSQQAISAISIETQVSFGTENCSPAFTFLQHLPCKKNFSIFSTCFIIYFL
jgi:hypothetical protein